MTKNIVILLLLSLIFSYCSNRIDSDYIAEINTESKEPINISSVFSNLSVIDIETTDSSLIGLAIKKVEYYQGKFFLLNQLPSHRNILCFDKNGKFLYKIDNIGNGPHEYTYLNTFLIDKHLNCLYLQLENNNYHIYNLEGKYISECQAQDKYYSRQILYKNSDTIVVYNDQNILPEGYNFLLLNPHNMNIINKFAINETLINTGMDPISVYNNNVLFYSTNDTIYRLLTDISEFKPVFFVNLGSKTVSSKKLLQNINPNLYLQKLTSLFSSGSLTFVNSLFESQKYLLLHLMKNGEKENSFSASNVVNSFVLFDKKTHKSYNSNRIKFDLLNLERLPNIKMVFFESEKLYCLIDRNFSDIEVTKIKESSYLSEKDVNILSNRDVANNPILLCFSN